ncbi:signal peptidase I [Naasia lichenicola]|uniref:signal peptidase I n=1 Tax=Naasia lichenicola TaxID=2565933 RepID=UPI00130D65E4|nr:signal peptidase I [Naasia lichenicola]
MSGRHRRESRLPFRGSVAAIGLGISWGVLALVVGLGLATVVVPFATGSTPLTVLTGSMQPTLPPGTLLIVRPTEAADIRLGDVLTYQIRSGSDEVVSHRVVEVRSVSDGSFAFMTKGDANDIADVEPVTEGQVRGTTWYSVPFVGYLATAISGGGRQWLAPLIGVGLVGYAFVQVTLGLLTARRRRIRLQAEARRDPAAVVPETPGAPATPAPTPVAAATTTTRPIAILRA